MASPFPFVAGQVLTAAELNEIEPQLTFPAGFASASYYGSPFSATTVTNTVPNRAQFAPFYVSETTTFDRISFISGGAVTNPTVFRLGAYTNVSDKPSALVFDAGTVSVTAVGSVYEITISETLTTGNYWLAICNETAATTTQTTTFTGTGSDGSVRITANSSNRSVGWFASAFASPFPATVVTVGNLSTPTLIQLRKA